MTFETLADAIPREIARVRDDVLPVFESLRGQPNILVEPQIAMMKHAMDEAMKAAVSGDLVRMIHWHHELKGFSL